MLQDAYGTPLKRMSESSYFFKLGKYQTWLVQYIQDHPEFVQVSSWLHLLLFFELASPFLLRLYQKAYTLRRSVVEVLWVAGHILSQHSMLA